MRFFVRKILLSFFISAGWKSAILSSLSFLFNSNFSISNLAPSFIFFQSSLPTINHVSVFFFQAIFFFFSEKKTEDDLVSLSLCNREFYQFQEYQKICKLEQNLIIEREKLKEHRKRRERAKKQVIYHITV